MAVGQLGAIAEAFFPTTAALLQQLLPNHYEQILPQECSEHSRAFNGAVAWPMLLLIAAAGVLVGLHGYLKLLRQQQQPCYRLSFLYFAGMNASAIVCHNIIIPDLSNLAYRVVVGLDVGFTCASSLCLILGAWSRQCHSSSSKSNGNLQPSPRRQQLAAALAAWLPPLAIAASALGNALSLPAVAPAWPLLPFFNETLYIYTTLAGAGMLFKFEVLRPNLSHAARSAICASAASFGLFFPVLAFSRQLCQLPPLLQPNVLHAVFLACDCAFLFLQRYLQEERLSQTACKSV